VILQLLFFPYICISHLGIGRHTTGDVFNYVELTNSTDMDIDNGKLVKQRGNFGN
jgi:hypothetical protein